MLLLLLKCFATQLRKHIVSSPPWDSISWSLLAHRRTPRRPCDGTYAAVWNASASTSITLAIKRMPVQLVQPIQGACADVPTNEDLIIT